MKSKVIILLFLSYSNILFGMSTDESLKILEGKWGWAECTDNVHEIIPSPNREFLEYKVQGGSYFYYVSGMDKKGLKLVMLNESQFDEQGNLISWYLLHNGNTEYYWLRSDRKENDLRGPVVKCK